MSTPLIIAAALVVLAVVGAITMIACTALRRADPAAVPRVLKELTPLLGILLRRRRS
ncbi:hypothetical protein ACFQ2B_40385 [Streptomyces stramineus]|uniref:hypothetical protein n=1 Tax=Streptomyces TaxID=1883 RepID=UPI0031DD4AD5